MEDPGWAWPAWKFGMRREDLTTKLHDQYNTFAFALQDPEAFHHDVWEVAREASTTEEFHGMMAARKEQRIHELYDSLESAAFEIIANPKLVGSDQWQYALQLFRTRSLDSLVRYFASYLPESYPTHGYQTPPSCSSTASSFADTCSVKTASTNPSSVDDCHGMILTDHEDEHKPLFTHEPDSIHISVPAPHTTSHLPPSPRSMIMASVSSISSPAADPVDVETRDFALEPPTPARSMSFSGSESGVVRRPFASHTLDDDDDETSQSEGDSPAVSEPDLSESHSSLDSISAFSESDLDQDRGPPTARKASFEADDDDIPNAQLPTDSLCEDLFNAQYPMDSIEAPMESETPTPRQETPVNSYLDIKSTSSYRIQPSHQASSPKSPRMHRRESPVQCIRRSPEELFSRVLKAQPDPTRSRPKGRRRVD